MNIGTTTCTQMASDTVCVGPVYSGPSYADWLFTMATLIFFTCMLAWPRFFVTRKS